MRSFTKEPLHLNDVVVYLRNERTGSSTVRKCKYVGQIVDFTKQMVKIMRLSERDTFVTPEEYRQLEIDRAYPEDIICIVKSVNEVRIYEKGSVDLPPAEMVWLD